MYIIGSLFALLSYLVLVELIQPEDKRLQIIEESLGTGVKYLGKSKGLYVFAMPYGEHVDTEGIQKLLRGFLGRHVEVKFDKYLYIKVYDFELGNRYYMVKAKKDNSRVIVGRGYEGKVYHDFTKYPHMIVAGHTGYGKTEFIKSLIPQLEGEIVLIDMKAGDDYPLVTANNVEEAERALREAASEIGQRRKEHLFVIIDEAAELLPPEYLKTRQEKEPYLKCQEYIHKIARMGRSSKIHLIYATQYPTANVVPGQIKQNCETRIVFRLPTQIGSGVALDESGAEHLPAGVYGRAIYKNDRKVLMHTYLWKGEDWYAKIRVKKDTGRTDIIDIG